MQEIEAGGDALGLLHDEAIEVAAAHEILDFGSAVRIDPDPFEGLATEAERRFEGLAHLELNALSDKLQAVAAIVGTHVELRAGKLGVNEVDDTARGVTVVDADGN